ncbi:hypothetical protein ABPG72_020115 [Tetrahymena utriculariae]
MDNNENENNKKIKYNDSEENLSNQFDKFIKIAQEQNQVQYSENQQIKSHLSQLDSYFLKPPINRKQSPELFWKQQSQFWPLLSEFAIKYLTPPMSTTSSERVFSTSAYIHNDYRNRILPENLQKLIFLKYNLQQGFYIHYM